MTHKLLFNRKTYIFWLLDSAVSRYKDRASEVGYNVDEFNDHLFERNHIVI